MVKLLTLVLCSLGLFAAAKHQDTPIYIGEYGYRGYKAIGYIFQGVINSCDATFNTSTNQVETDGSCNFSDLQEVYFFPQTGATLPNIINTHISYWVCNHSAGNFRIVVAGAAGCSDPNFLVQFAQAGSGDMEVGTITTGLTGNTLLGSFVLPSGVTVTGCWISERVACGTSGADYVITSNVGVVQIEFTIAAGATLGSSTWEYTLSSTTSAFSPVTRTFPFEIKTLTPLTISHPTSFTAIADKATWISNQTTAAAEWCPDKANGTINPDPLAELQFSSTGEQQVWYYDGAFIYYNLASFLNDSQWKNCGDTLAKFYRNAMFTNNAQFTLFNRAFGDGLLFACKTCLKSAGIALDLLWNNNIFLAGGGTGSYGSMAPINLRPAAYAVEIGINKAIKDGYVRYADIPAGTFKNGLTKALRTLQSQINVNLGANYSLFQAFQGGLAMRAGKMAYYFTGDPVWPVEIKAMLDMMTSEMFDGDVGNPNQMAYMRGAAVLPVVSDFNSQGPNCPFRCNPYPMTTLTPMVHSSYAWMWYLTNDAAYKTTGDSLFTVSTTYTPNSGKEFSEMNREGWDYLYWRELKIPLWLGF